jgi:hypothetical protein
MSHFSTLDIDLKNIEAACHDFARALARTTTHDPPSRDVTRWYFRRVFPDFIDYADDIYYSSHLRFAFEASKRRHYKIVNTDKFFEIQNAIACSSFPHASHLIVHNGHPHIILSIGWYGQIGAVATGWRLRPALRHDQDQSDDGEYYVGRIITHRAVGYKITPTRVNFIHDGPLPSEQEPPQEDLFG